MQRQPRAEECWPNTDKDRKCWKIDIKFDNDWFSIFMLKLLIRSVARTGQDDKLDEGMVEDLSKALEESKFTSEEEQDDEMSQELNLYPSPEMTLDRRTKGQHLSYAEKLHIMKLHKYQSWMEDKIWTLYSISHSAFRQMQKAFVPGMLPKLSDWRRLPSKLLHSKLLIGQMDWFVCEVQSQVTVRDVQSYLKKQVEVQVPAHIITAILKEKLKYSWKRNPQRVVDLDLERIRMLKILYSVRLSWCLSHLGLLVNTDESSFSKSTWNPYSWTQRGEEKAVKGIIFKGSVSVISSITTTGHSYTEVIDGTLNSKKFTEYLDRLFKYLKDAKNVDTSKIGLILDNCSVHRSREVSNYFARRNIAIILLPPYWPEFAPVELLFSLVKRNIMKIHKNEGLDLSKECNRSKILKAFQKIDWSCIRNIWKPMFSKMKKSIDELVTIL